MPNQYEEAEEKLQDWLGYEHIIERIKFSRDEPRVSFHFDNGLRVGLLFHGPEKTFNKNLELSQFHNQFGSSLEITENDIRVIHFVYKILTGEATPLILKCEDEIQSIWKEES